MRSSFVPLLPFLAVLCVFPMLLVAIMKDPFFIPNEYPLFKQCNSSWRNDVMESQTICDVGCLLSSVSMAFTFYHVRVNDKPVDPGTLNTWLKENGGYLSNDELIETTLEQLPGIHYKGSLKSISHDDLVSFLRKGWVVIANVRDGSHFVLVTGFTTKPSETWAVNDPGFNQTSYKTSDIVGYRVFQCELFYNYN